MVQWPSANQATLGNNVLRGTDSDDTPVRPARRGPPCSAATATTGWQGGRGAMFSPAMPAATCLPARPAATFFYGGANADTLRGGEGADALEGDGGRDVVVGGNGRDTLAGGAGADVFRFASATEVGLGRSSDTILDFEARDEIDLSGIDADTTTPRRHDAFSLSAMAPSRAHRESCALPPACWQETSTETARQTSR